MENAEALIPLGPAYLHDRKDKFRPPSPFTEWFFGRLSGLAHLRGRIQSSL